jgi:hypothetical protein
MISFDTQLLNQTKVHQVSPYSPTKTAVEEKMSYSFLFPITKPAKSITLKSPPAHPILFNQSGPENKPQDKSMSWDSQGKPDNMTARYLWELVPKAVPSFKARIDPLFLTSKLEYPYHQYQQQTSYSRSPQGDLTKQEAMPNVDQ